MSHIRRAAIVGATVLTALALTPAVATARSRPAPAPTVSSLSVASGSASGGTRLTVHGTGFAQVTAVHVGGLAGRAVRVLSSGTLQVTTPAHAIGMGEVRVISKHGTSAAHVQDRFTFRRYVTMSAGSEHACTVVDGLVYCSGYNFYGQLGNGSTTNSATPVKVSGLAHVVAVGGGQNHTCALRVDGSMWCWGDNMFGQLGNGTTTGSTTPVKVSAGDVTEIAVGYNDTCAVLADGTARCWGDNSNGQVGNGTVTMLPVLKPAKVQRLTNIVDLAAGGYEACAIVPDHTARCWGGNAEGQLGNGFTTDSATPVKVSGLTGASRISVGNVFACAVAKGVAKCWGYGSAGALGNGVLSSSSRPVTVLGLTGVSAVSAGQQNVCAISRGFAYCWGSRSSGAIGDNMPVDDTNNQPTPATVLLSSGVTQISAGGTSFACAQRGHTACWGANTYGQLGNASTTSQPRPVRFGGTT